MQASKHWTASAGVFVILIGLFAVTIVASRHQAYVECDQRYGRLRDHLMVKIQGYGPVETTDEFVDRLEADPEYYDLFNRIRSFQPSGDIYSRSDELATFGVFGVAFVLIGSAVGLYGRGRSPR